MTTPDVTPQHLDPGLTTTLYFRVEDANVAGLNGFHRIADSITDKTLTDSFYTEHEAKQFAIAAKKQFLNAAVAVVRWEWFVDDRGYTRTKMADVVLRPGDLSR